MTSGFWQNFDAVVASIAEDVRSVVVGASLLPRGRRVRGFGIPCRYPKAIGKYGFGAGMSVPNNPRFGGIAWYCTGITLPNYYAKNFCSGPKY